MAVLSELVQDRLVLHGLAAQICLAGLEEGGVDVGGVDGRVIFYLSGTSIHEGGVHHQLVTNSLPIHRVVLGLVLQVHLVSLLHVLSILLRDRLSIHVLLDPRVFVDLIDSDSLFGFLLKHLLKQVNSLRGEIDLDLLEVPVDNALIVLANDLIKVVPSKDLTSRK